MKLIFLGSEALADGFALLGFEIFPNATVETVEKVLADLLKRKEKALVFIEDTLSRQPSPSFLQVRNESDRIVITEIPPLHAPETYQPLVEDLVVRVLGAAVLETETKHDV